MGSYKPPVDLPVHRLAWLVGSIKDAKAILRQYPDEYVVTYKMSTRVNKREDDDESLIEAVN